MGRHKKQPDPNHMTPKQQAVFDYIKQCVLERNYPQAVSLVPMEVAGW